MVGKTRHIVYLGVEKHTVGRAPALQTLHTLRALAETGVGLTYVTPWSVRHVQSGCLAMTGTPFPSALKIESLGSGPDLPVLDRLWPTQVWSGVSARLHRFLQSLPNRSTETVVYTRARRIAAGYPSGHAPPMLFEYHEPQSVTLATGTENDRRVGWIEAEERRAIVNAKGLITVSPGHHAEVQQLYDYGGPRWMIPNGVNPADFAVSNSERRPVAGRLLYVGALKAWKGLELVLAVLKLDPELELHVCGGGHQGVDQRRLQTLAKRLGVAARVRWHGAVSQSKLRSFMATAMVGLLPLDGRYSLAERYTCPLKLLEYLAAGLPVVATDLPSVRNLVTANRHALLYSDGDVLSLQAVLSRLRNEPELAERLARDGREIPQQFTWQQRANRILAACDEVLAAQHPIQTQRAA